MPATMPGSSFKSLSKPWRKKFIKNGC